jgi:Uma2 family endonuclease
MENEVKEPAPKYNYISPEDYLALERFSEERGLEERNEYCHGQIYPMPVSNLRYHPICSNIVIEIGSFVEQNGDTVMPPGMRISTPSRNCYFYPDASIVCGEIEFEDYKQDTLLNPAIIIEILPPLSQLTSSFDKVRKIFFYSSIPSLKEYIIIDSQKRFIQTARRTPENTWKLEDLDKYTNALHIQTINFELPLSEIYADTGL